VAGRIRSIEESSVLIGNGTRDLVECIVINMHLCKTACDLVVRIPGPDPEVRVRSPELPDFSEK
jgi:hypothetical protein